MQFDKQYFEQMSNASLLDVRQRMNKWLLKEGELSQGDVAHSNAELEIVAYWEIAPEHPAAFFAYLRRYDLIYNGDDGAPYHWRHSPIHYGSSLEALFDLEFTYDEMIRLIKSYYRNYAQCIHTIAENREMLFQRPNGEKFIFRVELTPYPTDPSDRFLAKFLVGYGNTKESALWAALKPIRDQGYIERKAK